MSNPANPLSEFNSYSYHQVLVAASNSDVVEAITNNSDMSLYEHPSRGGKYAPISLGNLGGYIVLINSMTDAEFFINDVQWGSIFMPNAGKDSTYNYNAIETDGEMIVVEPKGMRFINVISEAAQTLGIAAASMPFILKTIFVGQRGDGEIETISTVRPIVFTIVDMQAKFDYTGATYTISLVGGRDGYAKHPGIAHILAGSSLKLNKGQTIANALDNMFADANKEYQRRLTEDIAQHKKTNVNTPYEPGVDFLPITYVVKYDTAFENYTVADNDDSSTKEKDGGHTVAFQPEQSLLAGISRIMESSAGLMRDTGTGVDKDGRNRKFTYKVTDEAKIQQDRLIITYEVKLYELTPAQVYGDDTEQGKNIDPPPQHVINFDYVYTGKNIDILDFDMNMDMALAYFISLTSSRSFRSQAEYVAGTSTEEKPGNSSSMVVGVSSVFQPKGIPKGPKLFFPSVKNETNKKVKSLETNQQRQILASFAQMSTIGVKLKIAGNPNILETLLIPPPEAGTIETPITFDRETNQRPIAANSFDPDWSRLPGYCKINIMMPSSSDEPGVYEKFWYDGYYRIISVRNSFSDGEFTQELELYSMPLSSAIADKATTTGEPVSPTEKRTVPSEVVKTPSTTQSSSDNVPSNLYSEYDDKIVEAANRHGVDANLMRALFKKESDFCPNAVAGIRCNQIPILGVNKAAGLGQMIPSTATWIAHDMIGDPGFRVDSVVDDRYDIDKNINMSTWYMRWLLNMWDGNTDLALASYNAGQGRVKNAGNRIPNIKETQDYVIQINEWIAQAETSVPTISPEPTDRFIDEMTPGESLEVTTTPTKNN